MSVCTADVLDFLRASNAPAALVEHVAALDELTVAFIYVNNEGGTDARVARLESAMTALGVQ